MTSNFMIQAQHEGKMLEGEVNAYRGRVFGTNADQVNEKGDKKKLVAAVQPEVAHASQKELAEMSRLCLRLTEVHLLPFAVTSCNRLSFCFYFLSHCPFW